MTMICNKIQALINYAINCGLIEKCDVIVVRNAYMDIFKLTDWKETPDCNSDLTIDEILEELVSYACERSLIENTAASRDLFDTKLMGIITPMPREVIREFESRKRLYSAKSATDWYYSLCRSLNYVRAGRIAKDKKWIYSSEYGDLDITINCSKPEKDPRDIAAAGKAKASSYPKCQLCYENAGFAGTINHPARQNLRPVPVNVGGENWQLQYSPYGYYNEHCIFFNEEHKPMKIDRSVFIKLASITDEFPHYFVGSNADLPIVGGSILSHEHFQGGRCKFAMEKAEIEESFKIKCVNESDGRAGIVKWPMSVIRLTGFTDKVKLADTCNFILEKWRSYSDESVDIISETNGTPHNTITPIMKKNESGEYECDLVLRNNRTTEQRPLGIFHPNPSLHHIKKENIGLIEVMGLAVLPARLSNELNILAEAILSGKNLDDDPATSSHSLWARELLKRHPEFSAENAEDILRFEVGAVFEQVLCDAGVFKRNDAGKAAFRRFIETLKN